ncbi:Transposase IS200 like protein [[Ruminococcus] torques]|uniref:Transposase IS200 like protein n=1 Tax=[Ruminococcus] torques TaxID=33039 RepID=A0A564U9Y6_9FIRM|nr:Transposase IS200 like protein [[Ruminococcus] torques]
MDNNSLSHTTWNCKYHIVFAPKYRRKIVFGELKQDIADILSILCKRKEVRIIEAEICPDHVHMLVEIPLTDVAVGKPFDESLDSSAGKEPL